MIVSIILCIALAAQANALWSGVEETQNQKSPKILTMIGQYTTNTLTTSYALQESFFVNIGDLGMNCRIAVVTWGNMMDSANVRVCFNDGNCNSYTLSTTLPFISFPISMDHYAKQMQIYMSTSAVRQGALTYQMF